MYVSYNKLTWIMVSRRTQTTVSLVKVLCLICPSTPTYWCRLYRTLQYVTWLYMHSFTQPQEVAYVNISRFNHLTQLTSVVGFCVKMGLWRITNNCDNWSFRYFIKQKCHSVAAALLFFSFRFKSVGQIKQAIWLGKWAFFMIYCKFVD